MKREEVLEIVGYINAEASERDHDGVVTLALSMASLAAEHMPAKKRRLWLTKLRGSEDAAQEK